MSTEFLVFCFLSTDNSSCQVRHEGIASLSVCCSGFVRHDELTATSKLYGNFLLPLVIKQKWKHRQLTCLSAGTVRFYRSIGEWHVALVSAALFTFKVTSWSRSSPSSAWCRTTGNRQASTFSTSCPITTARHLWANMCTRLLLMYFFTVQLFLLCSLFVFSS